MTTGNENKDRRAEFLIHMYDQMFNDINRHINVIWQPITVLIGSFALLAAGMRDILPIDIAFSLILLLDGWLIANLYDSSYWYNRNLVIIANIERQFLKTSDLKEIQYYFGEHRKKQAMIRHIRIQWILGLFIGITILIFHLFNVVFKSYPDWNKIKIEFRFSMLIPYIVGIAIALFVYFFKKNREKSYEEFVINSPGIKVDTSGITYGAGHPVDHKMVIKHETDPISRKIINDEGTPIMEKQADEQLLKELKRSNLINRISIGLAFIFVGLQFWPTTYNFGMKLGLSGLFMVSGLWLIFAQLPQKQSKISEKASWWFMTISCGIAAIMAIILYLISWFNSLGAA